MIILNCGKQLKDTPAITGLIGIGSIRYDFVSGIFVNFGRGNSWGPIFEKPESVWVALLWGGRH